MAKRFFRVQNGDRQDLAAIGGLTQADLGGYAFPQIFPLLPVTEKSGTMTVAPAALATAKGTKGRSNSASLTASDITMVDVNWSAVRYEGRGRLYENDGAAYATEADADKAGAELAQRLAWNKVEDEAFATLFTSARKTAAAELTSGSVVKILQQKAKTVRKYGKATLVMTTNTWLSFCEIPEIQNRVQNFAKAGGDIAYLTMSSEKTLSAISTLLAFDKVVLFDSDIVDASGTYDGIIAVMGLRPEAATSPLGTIKARATYGFCPVYIPEDAPDDKPFDMRSWYDEANKANVYDAEAFLGITEVFTDCVVPVKLASSYS